MEQERIINEFKEMGVLMEGHFLLTSGRHSNRYMQCAKVFQHPDYAYKLSKQLAKNFENDNINLVIGPAIGGIILSYEMAKCLGVKSIFAERENNSMVLRRGFEIPNNSRVLVVEDVTTTGGSVNEVIELVRESGGQVAGVAILVDRSNGNVDFGVKTHSLLSIEIESFHSDNCPLCRQSIPLIKPGSRKNA